MFLLDNNGALRHEGRRYKTLTTQIVLVTMITFMLVLVFSKDYLTMRRNVEYHQPRSVQFGYAYYLEARGFFSVLIALTVVVHVICILHWE